MGHRFFESTMPKVADELERLNANLEALVAELRTNREARADDANASGALRHHGPATGTSSQKIDP